MRGLRRCKGSAAGSPAAVLRLILDPNSNWTPLLTTHNRQTVVAGLSFSLWHTHTQSQLTHT